MYPSRMVSGDVARCFKVDFIESLWNSYDEIIKLPPHKEKQGSLIWEIPFTESDCSGEPPRNPVLWLVIDEIPGGKYQSIVMWSYEYGHL